MALILVCEDHEVVRQLLVELLAEMGLETVCADNGEEGLSLARVTHPDLVISDIVMPKMSGTQLVDAIRRDPDLAAIPCVLMSSPDWEEEALRAGCNSFIAKPFDVYHVRQVVRSLLGWHD
ncbi:MAG: hypothetical protein BZY88_15525 [SAR202 cluster bacterium Io17-Chloro-G9]|nr:MAG: hypothetical protein BZY88_15525 [SAR202 cluster bacterium Io17-Chloro-G9]